MPERPEMNEVATTQDGRDITRGYLSPLELMQPEDKVLMRRGGGDLQVYEELKRDDQVSANWGSRQDALVQAEWYVEPGGDTVHDKTAADFLREQLQQINFDALTKRMHYGVFYGYAVAECLYVRDGRHVALGDIRVRNRRRFGFDGAGRLRLKTHSQPMGELMPERKFWVYSAGADHDDEPYGLGLGHYLYWPVFFKRSGLRLWLIFLDKFGQPTGKGKYPANATPQEKQRLLDALSAIHTESGVILPEGMDVELIEAARSGTADYASLYDRMDKAISKVVLGHSGSADSTPGRLGGEDMASHVRDDIVKADADVICESFNRGPARWLVQWNYPNAATPKVWRKLEQPEDLGKVAERDERVARLGFKPSLQYIRDTYGDGWEDDPAKHQVPAASFSEREDEVPKRLADQLESESDTAMDRMIDAARSAIDEANTLEEARGRITEMFDEVPDDQLARIMQKAVAASMLAGMFEIAEESGDTEG
ncbi:DUF935 domain-containing protein [Desulfonatronovibrio hydrogenovorans]|uniref:DUF935 domain-containing protein n=1 Tax=Desulfonatronovibrio hydrogenovorans TaxID=53245 RepID=UPI00048C6CC3|nr:DUF935 family protein [Desulfonatronovibrio hydrogenovorans]